VTTQELLDRVRRLKAGDELPHRVVVNSTGYATSPRRAAFDYGVCAQICFVRRDGWTLAAPVGLAGVAWDQWQDQWVAVVALPCHAGQRMDAAN
jgi:hypothetical protein